MSAEKNNGKKEQQTAGGCCAGMTEMMRGCCPNGIASSDYCAWMKEMGQKFWRPETNGPANEKENDSKA